MHLSKQFLKQTSIRPGETEGHPYFLPRLKIREITRSGPAFTFLLPRPDMWPKDKRQVVVTLKKNYTVDDYEALFQTIGCEWCWDMFKDNIYTLGSLEPPSVAVHCIYGSQLPTTEVWCNLHLTTCKSLLLAYIK